MSKNRRTAWAAIAMIVVPLLVIAAVKLRPAPETPHIESIVVLPAKVFGQSADLGYLSDAVAGTLSTHLARVEGLETKAPPSSLDLEGAVEADYTALAESYGVDALVMTAITVDSGVFQLNLQVIDPRNRRLIWRNPYQAPRGKYLELIRAAGEGVRQAVRPESSQVRSLPGESSLSEAELAFREGRHYQDRFNRRHQARDHEHALAAFNRALSLDPNFTAAAAEVEKLQARGLEERREPPK